MKSSSQITARNANRIGSTLLKSAILVLSPSLAMATDGTWIGLGNSHLNAPSSFGNSSNWSGGIVASGPDSVATVDFVNSAGTTPTIDMDTTMTVGSLVFKNSGSTTLTPTIWGNGTSTARPVITMATTDGSMPRFVISQPTTTTMPLVQLSSGVGALTTYWTIASSQGLYVDLGNNAQLNLLSSPWLTTGSPTPSPAVAFSGNFVIASGTYGTGNAGTAGLPPSGSAHVVLGDSTQPTYKASLAISTAISAGALDGNTNSYLLNSTSGITGTSPNTSQSFVTMTLGTNNDSGTFAGLVGRGQLDAATLYKTNINFIKSGTGTQRFSGTMLNGGSTTINGGTWVVNGSHTPIINQGGSISGVAAANLWQPKTTGTGGTYVINTGGTLAGTGSIKPFDTVGTAVRMIDVLAGGSIAPGDGGIGTLTLDGASSLTSLLTFESGSTLNMDIGGLLSDQLAITNTQANDVTFNNNVVNLNVLSSLTASNYLLITSSAGTTYAGLTVDGSGTVTAGLQLSSAFVSQYPGSSLQVSGGNISLNVVPEPASLGLLGIGTLTLLRRPVKRRFAK